MPCCKKQHLACQEAVFCAARSSFWQHETCFLSTLLAAVLPAFCAFSLLKQQNMPIQKVQAKASYVRSQMFFRENSVRILTLNARCVLLRNLSCSALLSHDVESLSQVSCVVACCSAVDGVYSLLSSSSGIDILNTCR